MSSSTLKFFDNLTTESIINWMITNLSDDQIKMCLNKSGIPDISSISPTSSPGAGSSSDPIGSRSSSPIPSQSPPSDDDYKDILMELYTKCNSKGYVIKSANNYNIEYYRFKELEPGDAQVGLRTVNEGEATWVYIKSDMATFKELQSCNDEISTDEMEAFEFLKDEYSKNYMPAPPEVIGAAMEYSKLDFEPPIDTSMEDTVSSDTPRFAPLTDVMMKALNTQKKSGSWMRETFPEINDESVRMWPIFLIGSEDKRLTYIKPVVRNESISFVEGTMLAAVINTVAKKASKEFYEEVSKQGISGDIITRLNEALKDQPEYIIRSIEFNYNEDNHRALFGDNYFGEEDEQQFGKELEYSCGGDDSSHYGNDPDYSCGGDDSSHYGDENDDTNFGGKKNKIANTFNMSSMYEGLDDDMDQDNSRLPDVPRPMITGLSSGIKKNKKVSEMTIQEIEERMLKQHGPRYLKDFKPEKYRAKTGHINVRYVKRSKCVSTSECTCTSRVMDDSSFGDTGGDCAACTMSKYGIALDSGDVFSEFNTGFGDQGEELLF